MTNCGVSGTPREGTYGTIIKLLILTGQRRSEISGLRWSEVGADTINLPGDRTKNKRPHVVPLAPTARALLAEMPRTGDAVFEFTAWAYSKDILDKRSGVSGWTVHDIRRSVATGMADIGIPPHIIERMLNHVKAATRAASLVSIIAAPTLPRRRPRWRGGMSTSLRLLGDDQVTRKGIARPGERNSVRRRNACAAVPPDRQDINC